MDINDLKVFRMLGERMRWLNQRQEVIARNVANADTPKYAALDLAPPDFRRLLNQSAVELRVASTQAGHLAGSAAGDRLTARAARQSADRSLPGNTVVLEDEMMKSAETAKDYELMSTLYAKHLAMVRTALGRGGR